MAWHMPQNPYLKDMMTFYSPLYKSNVKIVRTRCDYDGEPIYHALINGKEILFRASELEGEAVLNEKKI